MDSTIIKVKISKTKEKVYNIINGDKRDIYDFVAYILNKNPMKDVKIIDSIGKDDVITKVKVTHTKNHKKFLIKY